MRINKFLASCGLGSRRKVEELILSGAVRVNGVVVKDLATDISDRDEVLFRGHILHSVTSKVYYVLNKPRGVLCSCADGHGRKLIIDFVPSSPSVFPVGRLDYDTTGLIILTNDGDFANSIIHPSKVTTKVSKTYKITTNKALSVEDKKSLECGVEIDGKVTLPAKITTDKRIGANYYRYITIYEGKNRQIRKMFDSIGHSVIALERIAIGNLKLDNIPVGKYISLSKTEIENKIFGNSR